MTKEELEKENARLKEINAHTLSQLNLDNGELIIENEKLQKENAELKERNRELDTMLTGQSLLSNGLEEQLTKAKELIEKLLNAFASNDFFEEGELDAMAEAEQFLNGEKVIPCSYISCRNCDREDCEIKKLGLVEVEK